MRRILLLLLHCIFIMTQLTGCYDAKEIDDQTYVLTIGVDVGVSDAWRLTFQYNLMKGQKGGDAGGGGGEKYGTISIDAPSFYAAVDLLNCSVPRRLNFSHTKWLVFSEEAAKGGKLGTFMAPWVRYREIRRSMYVIISKGSARQFVEANDPYIGTLLTKNQQGLAEESNYTGFFEPVTLNQMYNNIKSPYSQPMAIMGAINNGQNFKEDGDKWENPPKLPIEYSAGELPRTGENKIEFLGCAVADGDTMVGELNAVETRVMLMARGDFKSGILTFRDPENPKYTIAVHMRKNGSPKVKVKFENGKPVISMTINIDGDIMAIQSRINYEDPKMRPIVEQAIQKNLKDELDKVIEKCKGWKCDIFGFGKTAVMQFGTIEAWEAYNWNRNFANAQVTTEFKLEIRRTGAMIRSGPIINSEGIKP